MVIIDSIGCPIFKTQPPSPKELFARNCVISRTGSFAEGGGLVPRVARPCCSPAGSGGTFTYVK
jgi:hypothetical protein